MTTTRMRYFSDQPDGPVELLTITTMDNAQFALSFPGVRGLRSDGFQKWVGRAAQGAPYLPVTRRIDYKRQPSLHVCSAKCVGGKPTGTCECQCGGANHGRGLITGLLASAAHH